MTEHEGSATVAGLERTFRPGYRHLQNSSEALCRVCDLENKCSSLTSRKLFLKFLWNSFWVGFRLP